MYTQTHTAHAHNLKHIMARYGVAIGNASADVAVSDCVFDLVGQGIDRLSKHTRGMTEPVLVFTNKHRDFALVISELFVPPGCCTH